MIVKKYIFADLMQFEEMHNHALSLGANPNLPGCYAKLAIIEYCSWIEESFDTIARRSMKQKLASLVFEKKLEAIIKKNHGFTFEGHFIRTMQNIVGLRSCENLIQELQPHGFYDILEAELERLKTQRNNAAHVNIRSPTTVGYDTPIVLIASLNKIFPIIAQIYKWAMSA